MTTETAKRVLPALDDTNRFFWTSGADGKLRFLRCQKCRFYIHPLKPICPSCHSRDLKPEAVSGKATIASFSINHQVWVPNLAVPYVIAIVELPEQTGLRLTTNIVNCPIEQVKIGMPVRVVFEHTEDVFIPLFEPATGGRA